jgi:hypothetical protein
MRAFLGWLRGEMSSSVHDDDVSMLLDSMPADFASPDATPPIDTYIELTALGGALAPERRHLESARKRLPS